MKNIESPSPEKFILTNKKRRIIKALMNEFIKSKWYDLNYFTQYIPEVEEYKKWLLDRAVFLKNIQIFFGIEVINRTWTGLIFKCKDKTIFIQEIFVQTSFREECYKKFKEHPFRERKDEITVNLKGL